MIWLAAAGHELVPALLVEHIILRIRKLCGRAGPPIPFQTMPGMNSSQPG
jgi:hypothetical protein